MKNWLKNLLFVLFSFIFLGVGMVVAEFFIREKGNPLKDPNFLAETMPDTTVVAKNIVSDSTDGWQTDSVITIAKPSLETKKESIVAERKLQMGDYQVIIGIFSERSNAKREVEKLKTLGYHDAFSISKLSKSVVSAGLYQKSKAEMVASELKNKGFDAGVDFEFLGGIISGSADYFINTRTDLLNYVPVAGTTGFATLLTNGGSVEDKGWEFNVTSRNINTRNFKWTTNFNITYQKNTLLKTPINDQLLNAFNDLSPTHILQVGQPVGSFWGIKYQGVNKQTGDPIFQDINKDGVINSNDAQLLGHARPDYFGGITNSFKYKNLELMVATQFSLGNKVYNLIRPVWENLGYSNGGGVSQVYANNSTYSLNRWQKPGDVTDVPRFSFINKNYIENSSMFLEDASFFRIRTVNLSYTFNKKIVKFVNNVQVYAQVQNLYVFTKYKGFDPEVSSNGGNLDRTAGVDYAAYPQARTVTFGLNLSF